MTLIDSEMAGPIGLKLGGMIRDMCKNVLAKESARNLELTEAEC